MICSRPTARAVGMAELGAWKGDLAVAVEQFRQRLNAATRLPQVEKLFSKPWSREACEVLPSCTNPSARGAQPWAMLVAWAASDAIGTLHSPAAPDRAADVVFERMR